MFNWKLAATVFGLCIALSFAVVVLIWGCITGMQWISSQLTLGQNWALFGTLCLVFFSAISIAVGIYE